jgi:hypothetical protein
MKHSKFFVLLLSIVLFSSANAGELKTFVLKQGSIKLEVPAGWQEAKNLFGIQMTLLGPVDGENRPVITIDSSDFSEFKFDSEALKKNDESYQAGRRKWLSTYNGAVKEFIPYHMNKLMNGKAEDHVLGFRYTLNENEFIEYSHFIKCKKNLYHLKTLLLSKDETKYKNDIEKLFKNFVCVE